jgi:uncharacterized protein (DUF1501 family)
MSDHHLEPLPSRIRDAAAEGCEESRLLVSRRAMLGMSAGFFAWAFAPRTAEAEVNQKRLLIVVLRGGLDGLHVAPPTADPFYFALRGSCVPAQLENVDATFSLNAEMTNFLRMFRQGNAALVHGVAPPLRIRSHFECQDNLESGLPGGGRTRSGWLNRLLSELQRGNPVQAPEGLEVGPKPLILQGPAPVLSWGVNNIPRSDWTKLNTGVETVLRASAPGYHALLQAGIRTDELARGINDALAPTTSSWRNAFRGAGRLLASPTGPRIAALTLSAWDTHEGQVFGLSRDLATLDQGLGDLEQVMGASWGQTVVVCVTEFGRTVRVNGTAGTDHGVGTVAFLAGGAVLGNKIHTRNWASLAPPDLQDGRDLRATIDTRALFKGVLQEHLGLDNALLSRNVFPQSQAIAPLTGLIKSPASPSSVARSLRVASAEVDRSSSPLARFRQNQAPAL